MTTTYNPADPAYFDEADLRQELTRVYDLCHGCRMCFYLCPSFPTMFDFIDNHDQVAERLTRAEQDQVVDECFGCKMCYVKCPYIPPHEWMLDFPRLMLRADAVRTRNKTDRKEERLAKKVLGSTDLVGFVSTTFSPIANAVMAEPNSPGRKVTQKVLGVAEERLIMPYARQRFSTWFKKRVKPVLKKRQGRAAVFPTCTVEYQMPDVGKDLVRVYEHNGVECSMPTHECCGAPHLHAGNVDEFVKQAKRNLPKLAEAARAGRDIVVSQPTCSYVLKKDYPDYVPGAEADLVAKHTYDACEYLWKLHKGEGTELDKTFTGTVPETITYHAPCHLQAQNIGLKGRDLLKLTGAKCQVVAKCSGIDGTWGLRAINYAEAKKVAQPLAKEINKQDAEVVTSECQLAGMAITEETGRVAQHPLSVLARAYGLPEG